MWHLRTGDFGLRQRRRALDWVRCSAKYSTRASSDPGEARPAATHEAKLGGMGVVAPSLFAFDHSFLRELEELSVPWRGAAATNPRLLSLNASLAAELGADPRAFGDPDHYAIRYTGPEDNGGVNTNSGIPNHAFYLAIEGGTNRTSGLAVQGVGAGNRDQIEKVFYRAFVHLLPSNATFRVARAATIQSARDLYGVGSPAERAVTEAWTAVGVV